MFDETVKLKDNAMLKHCPELFYEWNFEKNDELGLDVYTITKKSGKKVWWSGKCSHEFPMKVSHRTDGSGCPYCSHNPKTLKGFNDMWTTNSRLASLLGNPEDGYKYTQSSGQKVDWKCLDCGSIIKNKTPNTVYRQGVCCPSCSDGLSFGERLMFNLLQELKIDFKREEEFEWSDGKIYDFYLPDYNIVIEIHGIQHYRRSFRGVKGRSLEEEMKNDLYKTKLCRENDVELIAIDASISDIEYLKQSIFNTDLMSFTDMSSINWAVIEKKSIKSMVVIACELWNSGHDIKNISKRLLMSRGTIARYLKTGNKLGLCRYSRTHSKTVMQFDLNLNLISTWSTLTETKENTKISTGQLSETCRGKHKTAGGFKWMYKEDYDKMLQEGISYEEYMNMYYPKN